jgi:hypothetical protein
MLKKEKEGRRVTAFLFLSLSEHAFILHGLAPEWFNVTSFAHLRSARTHPE